jgi:chemotaxis protein methyltransferase CheR
MMADTGDLVRAITDEEFALFQRFIREECGISLSAHKKSLLVGRLGRRLRELGLTSFAAYYRHISARDPEERQRMLDRICTNETRFFREPGQFELLERRLVPEWTEAAARGARPRHIRVWSTACSTGEEPYSIAMVLLRHLPPTAGWRIEILASDLSTRVLAAAQEGNWPVDRAEQIPPAYRPFMLRGVRSQEGIVRAGPELRAVLEFRQLNLTRPPWGIAREFDLILCRNVLMYFDAPTKARVVGALVGHLAPAGYLFLGHAESLSGLHDGLHTVIPTAYRRRGAGEGPGRRGRNRTAPALPGARVG